MATDKKSAKATKASKAAKTTKATAKKATKTSAAAAKAAKQKAALAKEKLNNSHVGGFMNFIREQGVVGLAVGLAIGTAAGDTVKKLVEGFINPVVQFIVGSKEGLESATFSIEMLGRTAEFKWGAFVSSAITLVATAFVIYLIINLAKLDKLDKEKD